MVFAALIGGLVGAKLWYIAENGGPLFSGTGLTFYGGLLGGALAVIAWTQYRGELDLQLTRRGRPVAGRGLRDRPDRLPARGRRRLRLRLGRAVGDGVSQRHGADRHAGAPDADLRDARSWAGSRCCSGAGATAGRPGTLTAIYLIGAGLERFLIEFIRRNDAVALGLTQPQWVSLAMMVAGAAWLVLQARAPVAARRRRARRPSTSRRRARHGQLTCTPRRRRSQDGRLHIGGCDALELAREFGTPLYAVAEDDLRARAREFRAAMGDGEVVFASKAFPCTAVLRVFEEEGLAVDVASGGELALALKAGFSGRRIILHGNAKSAHELRAAAEAGARIVVDNFDEIDKLDADRRAGRGDDPRHAGRRGRHARRDPHRPRGLEVRLLARRRAARDRAARASAPGPT